MKMLKLDENWYLSTMIRLTMELIYEIDTVQLIPSRQQTYTAYYCTEYCGQW